MSVDPKDLRAGQRIDLLTDDGVEVRNLPLRVGGDALFADPFGIATRITYGSNGSLRSGIKVTAIRSQPDPELWLDRPGHIWQSAPGGGYIELVGRTRLDSITTLQAQFGPLRRLTAGDPIGDDQ